MTVTPDDHFLAAKLATLAGDLLVDLRSSLVRDDVSPAELKRHGDQLAHEFLMESLSRLRPRDAVLSEEGVEAETPATKADRLAARRVWIVDPLDGTREFSEPPRDDWAVHVALCVDGRPVVGAVSLPALGLTFSTADPPTVPPATEQVRVLVSRTRPPVEATTIAEALGAELVPMGSAGAKTMAILRGRADCYPHSGGQYEWDSAAPVAVAAAAGLWCSRIDGSPLTYNSPDPYLPDLLICRAELADRVLGALHSD